MATPNTFLDSHLNFVKNLGGWEVYIIYFFIYLDCFKQQNSPEKTPFNTLNLNIQNEYMINIKCQNKTRCFFQMCWP